MLQYHFPLCVSNVSLFLSLSQSPVRQSPLPSLHSQTLWAPPTPSAACWGSPSRAPRARGTTMTVRVRSHEGGTTRRHHFCSIVVEQRKTIRCKVLERTDSVQLNTETCCCCWLNLININFKLWHLVPLLRPETSALFLSLLIARMCWFTVSPHFSLTIIFFSLPLRWSGELPAQRGLSGQRGRPEETDETGSLRRSHATTGLWVRSSPLSAGLIRPSLRQQDGAGRKTILMFDVQWYTSHSGSIYWELDLLFLILFPSSLSIRRNHKLKRMSIPSFAFLTCTRAYLLFTPIANPCS